jgi:hypothetical protein
MGQTARRTRLKAPSRQDRMVVVNALDLVAFSFKVFR